MNTLPSKSTETHHWKIVLTPNPYVCNPHVLGINIPRYSLMTGKKSPHGIEYDIYDRSDDIQVLMDIMDSAK